MTRSANLGHRLGYQNAKLNNWRNPCPVNQHRKQVAKMTMIASRAANLAAGNQEEQARDQFQRIADIFLKTENPREREEATGALVSACSSARSRAVFGPMFKDLLNRHLKEKGCSVYFRYDQVMALKEILQCSDSELDKMFPAVGYRSQAYTNGAARAYAEAVGSTGSLLFVYRDPSVQEDEPIDTSGTATDRDGEGVVTALSHNGPASLAPAFAREGKPAEADEDEEAEIDEDAAPIAASAGNARPVTVSHFDEALAEKSGILLQKNVSVS